MEKAKDKTVNVHELTHKRLLFMYAISMNIYFSGVKFQRAVVSHKTMQYILKNDEIKFILHKDHNLKSDIFTLKMGLLVSKPLIHYIIANFLKYNYLLRENKVNGQIRAVQATMELYVIKGVF